MPKLPARLSTLTWAALAGSGFAPLVYMSLVETGFGDPLYAYFNPFPYLDPAPFDSTLERYLFIAPWPLIAIHLAGIAAVVVLASRMIAAHDDRIAERELARGRHLADVRTRQFLRALARLAVVVALGGYTAYDAVHTDAHGRCAAVMADFELRMIPAWDTIAAFLVQATPPPVLVTAGDGDAHLEAMLAYPIVHAAYHLSPQGRLAYLERDRPALAVDMRTWTPTHRQRRWAAGPRDRSWAMAVRRDATIERLAYGSWGFGWGFSTGHDLSWSAMRVRGEDALGPLVERAHPVAGRVGFLLDQRALTETISRITADRGLGEVMVYHRYAMDFDPDEQLAKPFLAPPQTMPAPWNDLRLELDSRTYKRAVQTHLERHLAALMALAVLLVAAMAEAARRLAAMWAARTVALAESNFVSGVSHEMRTPLATIKLYAELLEQGLEPTRQGEFARTITAEVDRLSRLIENVLDYARISGRRKTYALAPHALGPLVDEAIAAVAGPLAAASLEVQVHMPVPQTAAVDRDAFVQALVNLLANAVKYAPDGRVVLVSVLPRGTDAVSVEVQDFGPGLDPAEAGKVFQPFYRVGSELTRTTTGSGLGLALVREYARAHRGTVEVESEPGAGATFRLTLPLDAARPAIQEPRLPRRLAARWLRAREVQA